MSKSFSNVLWDYMKSFVLAVIFALFIRTYLFQITEVYGQSMYPTLHDHDRLFTNRIVYSLSEPSRGDIVILDAPDNPGTFYVKRTIAIAGDHLVIEDGEVYINGVLQSEPFINGAFTPGNVDLIIPEGSVFVMGDNRGNSHDSRDFSAIPISTLEGQAIFRIWPFDSIGAME